MKNVFIYITLMCAFFASCESHLEVHQEYHDGVDKVYLQQVDSCVAMAGNNRIILKLWYKDISHFEKSIIYYNYGNDSIVIDLASKASVRDSLMQELSLAEGNYNLEIVNVNRFNQRSLPTRLFASSYGENYLKSLDNRILKNAGYNSFSIADGFQINYSILPNNYAFLEMKYDDKEVRLYGENTIEIKDCRPEGDTFTYRTAFLPEENAIDTFYSEWSKPIPISPKTDFLAFDRTDWEAVAVSDETASDGGGKDAVLDGNLGTFWHSQWHAGNAPLPHWIIIDMKEEQNISAIETYRRTNNSDTKAGHYEICSDFDITDNSGSWKRIGNVSFSSAASNNLFLLNLSNDEAGRYLKLTLTESNRNPFTNIAEIKPGRIEGKYPE
ncbi:MAG: DUF4998 domain-containing protein [Bacteroidales bacterium]